MKKIKIRGGKPLQGHIEIGGMKNAALPIVFACILTKSTISIVTIAPHLPNQPEIRPPKKEPNTPELMKLKPLAHASATCSDNATSLRYAALCEKICKNSNYTKINHKKIKR